MRTVKPDHVAPNDASSCNQQRTAACSKAQLSNTELRRREAQPSDAGNVATRIPNQRSENGTKQQTKSEARPNEPSEPRAFILERRERELAVLWLRCGWSSLGGPALCASVLI